MRIRIAADHGGFELKLRLTAATGAVPVNYQAARVLEF